MGSRQTRFSFKPEVWHEGKQRVRSRTQFKRPSLTNLVLDYIELFVQNDEVDENTAQEFQKNKALMPGY